MTLIKNEIVEAVARVGVDGAAAGELLPTPDRRIDVKRIELHRATTPTDAIGSNQRRAAAKERVEDKIAAGRAIEDRIGDQGDRLYRRMQGGEVSLLPSASEVIEARVLPDISTVATMATQLDIVPVRCPAILEDEDQFVLARYREPMPALSLTHTHRFLNSE